jgi:hypothetical protein
LNQKGKGPTSDAYVFSSIRDLNYSFFYEDVIGKVKVTAYPVFVLCNE